MTQSRAGSNKPGFVCLPVAVRQYPVFIEEYMRIFLSAVVLLVVVAVFPSSCTRGTSKTTASHFTLQDLDGKTVTLSQFKGKPVLLDFWATWCPPCRAAIPGLENLHKSYAGKGLVVLGISMDQGGWDYVKSFASEYGITYTILKGTNDVFESYQVRTIPTVVLVNKEGEIVKRYLGFGGDDELEKDILDIL